MAIVEKLIIVSIDAIMWLIFFRIMIDLISSLSNTRLNRNNLFISFLQDVTEPFFKPFKRILPQLSVGIDLSPIFTFAVLVLLRELFSVLFSIF